MTPRVWASCGRNQGGWWARKGRQRRHLTTEWSMSDGSFWDVLRFFLVPNAYYVWRFKRQQQRGRP